MSVGGAGATPGAVVGGAALAPTLRTKEGLTVSDVLAHAGSREFERWREQVRNTGYCHHPVRLRGTITEHDASGSPTHTYETASEPAGVLLKACGNRRRSVCPPCSRTYGRDAYELISCGLRGGKGIPATICEHPMVFATFTAP